MKNIFISSTFIDMQAERDLVQERVLPAIRDEARKYGDNVGVIDLRWGVDTSTLETEEGAAKVLKVCLDEIDRSHPYMLIFLGERYGTMMREDQIEKSVRGREDKYTTDDYVKSITALEVEYGALSEKYGELNHCVVCFREPVVHMLDGAEKDLYAEHTEEGKRKLEALKERIKRDLGEDDRLITYSCTWDKSARQLVDFKSNGQPLENVLTNCFVEMFRDDWKEYESLSWQDKEQLAFRALMESKLRSFVGREALLEEYYQSAVNGTCPIILQGEVGSGKTAIMCKLVERLQKEGKNVFAFFAGAGSMSTNAESLVKQMVYYMENLLGEEKHFGEENAFVEMEEGFEKGVLRYSDWMERLRELCYRLPEEKKVYVCIDALDQICLDEDVKQLDFLIEGKGVQFVASCTNEFKVPMKAKGGVKRVPMLYEMDAKLVAESILASYSRNAYVAIEQEILKKESIGSPLYISLLIQRLNMMDAEELRKAMTEEEIVALGTGIIREMPDVLEDATVSIIKNGIARVSDNDDVLWEVLGYLAVSRNGLRMQDLQGIFSLQNKDFPILDVTLLLSYLDSFFYVNEDGRIDFTHKVIRGGVLKGINNRKHYEEGIKNYLLAVGVEDELTIKEGLYYARIFEEYAFAQKLIAYAYGAKNKKLYRAIKEAALADEGCFIATALEIDGEYKRRGIALFVDPYYKIFATTKKEREVKLFIGEYLLDICEQMYEESKSEEDAVYLADCLLFVGKSKQEAGKIEEAKRIFEKAMVYCEQIQERNGNQKNALRLMDVSISSANLVQGKEREEQIYARLFLRIDEFQKYSSIDMINAIATLFVNLGLISMRKGELKSAKKSLEQALEYRKSLVEKNDIENARQGLYSVYEKMGVLFREMGQIEKAKESLSECIKGREEEYTRNSTIQNLRLLQNSYLNMSYVTVLDEATCAEKSQSRMVLMKALQCAEKLYEIEKSVASLKELTVVCNNLTSFYLHEECKEEQSMVYFCKKTQMYAEILYRTAPSDEVEDMLATIYQVAASVYGAIGRIDEQKECSEKSLYFAKKNYGKRNNHSSKITLAGILLSSAQNELDKGRKAKAVEYSRKALGHIVEVKLTPFDSKELSVLVWGYSILAEALEDDEEAEIAEEKGIRYAKEVCVRFPEYAKKIGMAEMFEDTEEDKEEIEECGNKKERKEEGDKEPVTMSLTYAEIDLKKAESLYDQTKSDESLRELLHGYVRVGKEKESRSLIRDALLYYEKALKSAEALYKKEGDEESLRDLSEVYNHVCKCIGYSYFGCPREEHLLYYKKDIKCKEAFHERVDSEDSLKELAKSFCRLADALMKGSKLKDALLYYENALKCSVALYEREESKSNLDFLSERYFDVADVLKGIGRLEDALLNYGDALRCKESLYGKEGSEFYENKDLSKRCVGIGDVLVKLGRPKEALLHFENRVKCMELANKNLRRDEDIRELVIAYTNMAHALKKLGRMQEALSFYEKNTEYREKWLEKKREEKSAKVVIKALLQGLSDGYNYIGLLLLDLGRYEDAIDYFGSFMRNTEELYQLDSSDSGVRSLSVAYNNYGFALCELGKLEEALEYLEKALQYTEKIHEKNPTKNTQLAMVGRWRNLTKALLGTKRLTEALVYGKKAVELDRELYSQDSSDEAKERVIKSLSIYAETLYADNQLNEACEVYTEALEHCKIVCGKNDSIPNVRIYVKVLKGLYLCQHIMGQSTEAEEYLSLAKEAAKKLYERSGAEKDKKLLEELLGN